MADSDHLALAHAGAPGVVIAHDWFGLRDPVRALCDDLAAAGFSALAVDLYSGRSTADPAEAEAMMEGLGLAEANALLLSGVRRLRGAEAVAPRIAGLGFSMGGWLALHAAGQGAFDSLVTYYAVLEPEETVAIPCPLLLHLAEVDEWDPPDAPQRFVDAMRADGTPVEAVTHAGTHHSFANPEAAQADADATAQAWDRTLDFLRRTLGG